jgi:hypothetical protein
MSIRELWKRRVQDQELFKLGFLIPGPPERRTVLLSPTMNNLFAAPGRILRWELGARDCGLNSKTSWQESPL